MLVKAIDVLKIAAEKNRCAIGFDGFNYETVKYVVDVAEEEQIPVIIMIYPGMKKRIAFSTYAAMVKEIANQVTVPVALILDHGPDFETVMEAVKAGFPSVMIDASAYEYEENIRITSEVVKACHALGVDVEAELGHVGIASNENDYIDKSGYTNVEQAVEFVKRTGVDSLAVAIGTAHGNYVSEPKLDLERLDELDAALDVPLVLHGGSGVPEDQLAQAFKRGINKLNFATAYNSYIYTCYKESIENKGSNPRLSDLQAATEAKIKEFIRAELRLGWPKED